MYEILLNETQKVSAKNHEAQEFMDSDYDANNLYQVEKISFEDTKENLTDVSMRLNTKQNHVGFKIEII